MIDALQQRPIADSTIRNLALLVWALLFAGAWFIYLRPVSFGGPASYVVVNGPSMRPTLKTGDLTILQKRRSYHVGQIIAFRAEGGVAIHRVHDIDADGHYVTKGDNKPSTDPWLPTKRNVVGTVVLRVPYAGWVYQRYGALIFGWLVAAMATAAIFIPMKSKPRPAVSETEWREATELEVLRLRSRPARVAARHAPGSDDGLAAERKSA